MKSKSLVAIFGLVAAITSGPAVAATCPVIGSSSDCSLIITLNADGSFTATTTGIGPYDGSDDTLVGVINNGTGFLSSLTLSSSTDIFGFDGDGIDGYAGGGSYGVTGYEGPNTSFTVTDAFNGSVNFLNGGLAPGATAYFALEENLSGSVGGTGIPITIGGGTIVGGVPEPSLWAMMISGFGLVGVFLRRRSQAIADAMLAAA